MTNEEKAKFIADQCLPCSEDFYSGIKQGVLLTLNSEQNNLNKAQKWDELEEAIAGCMADENSDLIEIGELASHYFGF